MKQFNFKRFMNKQASEKERDINAKAENVNMEEPLMTDLADDNVAEDEESATDNVAVEPTMEEQLAAWRDKYLRLQAEFDNFRKRTIKEKMELVERGSEGAWKAMLPLLDDMDRAVAASTKSDDIAALRQGEELVMK